MCVALRAMYSCQGAVIESNTPVSSVIISSEMSSCQMHESGDQCSALNAHLAPISGSRTTVPPAVCFDNREVTLIFGWIT